MYDPKLIPATLSFKEIPEWRFNLVYVHFACYTVYCTCFERFHSELILSINIVIVHYVILEMYSRYFDSVNNIIIASQ